MESEARQNPLSKVETIEQLRTTIDKLETIIEQLNSTSVVDLPSSSSVAALIKTTEDLENAVSFVDTEAISSAGTNVIANPAPETVTPEIEPIPTSEEIGIESEDSSPTPREQISETIDTETPTSEITEKVPEKTPKTVTKPATKAQSEPKKTRKKKNWIPIAIIALIVAIIPISWKYIAPGIRQQLLSDNVEEVVENIVTEEPSVITTNPPENIAPKHIDNSLLTGAIVEDVSIPEIEKQQVEDLTVRESPQQELVTETELNEEIAVSKVPLIVEETIEPELDNYLEDIPVESTKTSVANFENSPTTKEKLVVTEDDLWAESITQPEIQVAPESSLNSALNEETANLEIENIPEPEPEILVPENLVAEETTESLEIKTVIHDLKLTPEQEFVAALREQVLELSQGYQEDLVLSIEPDFTNNILIVKIADDWYQLAATEQNNIVTDMFTRSQKLEFRKLEIKDQNNRLVARSPVVGQNMIILRRES